MKINYKEKCEEILERKKENKKNEEMSGKC